MVRKRDGQGLVEFALVLPLLLFVLVGMAEFGRVFLVYSNLFNAAREGARYGIVHPRDITGIQEAITSKIVMVPPSQVEVTIQFDSGPGTPIKSAEEVDVGDRVLVHLQCDVDPMVPLLKPLMDNLYVQTGVARTISSLGEEGFGSWTTPEGGTPPSTFTYPPLDDATSTPASEVMPTGTPTPTPTLTPMPDVPIVIDTPLREGDTIVSGSALAGQTLWLRDIQDPSLSVSTVVGANGRFTFRLERPLEAGHVIVVEGYDRMDWATVEQAETPTPTPTATFTPTPTPSGAYIALNQSCWAEGSATIIIEGYNWVRSRSAGNVQVVLQEGNSTLRTWTVRWNQLGSGGYFRLEDTLNLTAGVYTVVATQGSTQDVREFTVPCPATPTPTPTPGAPNLVITDVGVTYEGELSTFEPLTITAVVANVGERAANNLFWVDVYISPTAPISPADPQGASSTAWAAVSSLEAGAAITLTFSLPDGLSEVGDYPVYVLADTWDQVAEENELDNLFGPITVTVAQESIPPTPTPTPTPAATAPGAISGSTWLYLNGDVVSQGRVNVYCYTGSTLVAATLSDQEGNYVLTGVPPGTYTVIGEATINDVLYTDVVADVVVQSNETTQYVTLVLH